MAPAAPVDSDLSSSSSPNVWAVIMAGGVGSRFWPLSRKERPKQLVDLFGDGAMLEVTSQRVLPLAPPERQLVVTGTILGDKVCALLPDVPDRNVLCEPQGRNTAAAIAWAAQWVKHRDPTGILMVLPSDHFVADIPRYQEVCAAACAVAAEGHIVTLGIPPTRPETGYGYIQRGTQAASGAYEVTAFKEKPDLATAAQYLASGDFVWNAGMFFMPCQLILDELARFEPELMAAIEPLSGTASEETIAEIYPTLKSISIDYAVMERSDKVQVMPGEFGWSDVGSWRSLYDFAEDGASSFVRGDVIELDGSGNVLFADSGTVATVGVSDLVVVHTADATLVCKRDEAQRLREVVDALKAADRGDLL